MTINKKIAEYSCRHSFWCFYGEIDRFSDHLELIQALYEASAGDHITLYINSTGGSVEIGESIINAINNTEAIVHAVVEAPCWSMAAFLALCCHSLEFKENTFLMFHDYNTSYIGKGNEITKMSNIEQLTTTANMKKWCSPFLTHSEINKILSGEDVYILWDDSKLSTRIKRHFK